MMKHRKTMVLTVLLAAAMLLGANAILANYESNEKMGIPEDVDPIHATYLPVMMDKSFQATMEKDKKMKPEIMERQKTLLERRYDLSDNPSDVMMSAERKPVQKGVRVKLPDGMTWKKLSEMSPDQIRAKGLFPEGFLPLPHAKHETGGQVIPPDHIEEINNLEQRNLERFDVAFDLPDHLLPEFPPPIFLTTRPDLGDVSQGKLLSIRNYYEIMHGILTPVQMEGLRLLLTPFPQQQFNQTEDRKVEKASLGISCFDCHANGHTNAAFHLNPDTRPHIARLRLDTVSLRGMFNQQIHGSKRSLRSIEDFTEFEQRTAYFDGDHVTAAKKGVHLPDRSSQVSMMAQMQNILDFPPAPKLTVFGRLDPEKATKMEQKGEEIFFGKGRCAECHPAPFYLDDKMHNLQVERFYKPHMSNKKWITGVGPIKTFTLRGIKDSPPYMHDGRLLTLEDTVEFFNIVTELNLNKEEKEALTAFMRCL
ncbi:MAG TPA: cytochrome B6 [Desulfotignum sp.]|nr:cytochrome B6 [Desulfotignum sp.]